MGSDGCDRYDDGPGTNTTINWKKKYDRYTWTSSEVTTQNLSGGDGLIVAKAAEGADRCGAQSPKVIELGSMNLIGEGGAKVWGKPGW